MENSGRYYLNQVVKVKITNNGPNRHHVPPDMMHEGDNIPSVMFLPKIYNLNLIARKPVKYKLRDILLNKCPVVLTTIKVMII